MKTVLIVDPFSTGKLYARLLKAQGVKCYAVISTDTLPKHFTDDLIREDFEDLYHWEESLLVDLESLSLHAVIAGCETAIYLTDYLTKVLRIKGNSHVTSDLRRNKFSMQQALKHHGLANIESQLLSSQSHIRKVVDTLEETAPYVVKPLNSAATEGVVFAQGRGGVETALNNAAWKQKNDLGEINLGFIVQPFISGPEYVVDMVAFDGEYIIATVCKYTKIHKNGSKFVYESLDTLNPQAAELRPLTDYARQAAAALGVQVGPIHMEIIWSDAGPVMIEAGGRLHGGIAPLLFQQVYHPDLLSLAIDSYLDQPKPQADAVSQISHGRIGFFCSDERRTFAPPSPQVIQSAQEDEAYCGHRYFISTSDTTPITVDFATCPGLFWLQHPSAQQLDVSTANLRKKLWG
ncbi:ATP-grasp domain-containing protein [Pseudomonas sp. PB105]|uniref:ATP-grasp domain-containing protein n=1 Tax=unclassified Pseudomonas TaxID=196821 RepID=UPI00131E6ACE|nr:ATP-grasp domain-containing protein [Pseudomonas sp. PB105]KAE9658734.1 ATP-grasp domain-containing protein [Pseudomonas sp. PB105]MVW98468.1 ATP-grasp domain-containing protein [Pseudomonas sp. PB100]